ncbi:MAG: hypothetical protein NZ578_16005 [Candidatus Binatia bacterium]|nr:hypothetical protein [Candidatus Binatia bacterium]
MSWRTVLCGCAMVLLYCTPAQALTVEQVLALKKAGVSDETIQRLLEHAREDKLIAEQLGTWTTQSGRVIRSTGKRRWPLTPPELHQGQYPIGIYPFLSPPPP